LAGIIPKTGLKVGELCRDGFETLAGFDAVRLQDEDEDDAPAGSILQLWCHCRYSMSRKVDQEEGGCSKIAYQKEDCDQKSICSEEING
jgi:hypothetical protein